MAKMRPIRPKILAQNLFFDRLFIRVTDQFYKSAQNSQRSQFEQRRAAPPIPTYQAPTAQRIEHGLSAPIARPAATPRAAAQASSPPTTFCSAAIGAGAGTIFECGLALTRLRDIPTVRAVANTMDFRLNMRFIDSPFFDFLT